MNSSDAKGIVAGISVCADIFTFWNGTSNSFTYVRVAFSVLILVWFALPKQIKKPDLWYISLFLGLILLLGAVLSLLAVFLKAATLEDFAYIEFLVIGILYLVGGVICVLPTKEKLDK